MYGGWDGLVLLAKQVGAVAFLLAAVAGMLLGPVLLVWSRRANAAGGPPRGGLNTTREEENREMTDETSGVVLLRKGSPEAIKELNEWIENFEESIKLMENHLQTHPELTAEQRAKTKKGVENAIEGLNRVKRMLAENEEAQKR